MSIEADGTPSNAQSLLLQVTVLYIRGAYKVDDAKLKPNRNVTTTFVDRTTREIWKDNEMPGPGQYATNIPSCYKSSQILHCDN